MSDFPKTTMSVIVPCLNAAATLHRCLAALADQRRPPDEVIVADNGSRDGSLDIARRWMNDGRLSLRVLNVPKRGAAAARNVAALRARGEWIAFTDADCLPPPDWIERGLLAMAGRDVAALAGPAWGVQDGDAAARLLGLTSLAMAGGDHVFDDPGPVGMAGFPAANLWVRRDVFAAVGGFDEALIVAGEDMDLCARLYEQGHRLLYSSAVRVGHVHVSGVTKMCRKMVQYGSAHALLLKRHGRDGLHLDLPGVGSRHWPAPFTLWCNASSADKKALLLVAAALWNSWLWALPPLYVFWLARFLRKRACSLGQRLDWGESVWMGVLLIVKSAALTWGRLTGCRRGAWTC